MGTRVRCRAGTGEQYDNPGNYYGKLWEIKTVKVGANTLQDIKHTWDAAGNLTQRENVLDVEKETFGYDFLDRLTWQSNFLFKFGDTGEASSRVSTPWKAAVDNNGNIWVADTGNNRIAKYNSSGVYETYFGSYGTENGKFDQPSGVALDSSGNIYVSDYNNHRIQKFNSSFEHQWSRGAYGSGNGEFISPADIVFNPSNGFLYIADSANHRIQYFDTSGNYQGKWGNWGNGDSQFKYPFGVGVDTSGNVYVADMFNRKIKKFSTTETPLGNWGATGSGPGQFQYPRDVAVDASGNIFVADTSNHRIQKIAPTGQYTYNFIMMWGTSGSGQSQFSSPYGVALTSTRIYAVDTNNSRLQTFDLATTAGWAYNQIGNMTLNDGRSYTYGSGWAPPRPPQPHAVWNAGSTAYQYDDNGNMTNRGTQQLTPYQVRGRLWDVENRLIKIDGVPTYVYGLPRTRYGDGNGFRVKKTEGGVTTLYINKYYEKKLSDGTITLYYYLGDKMVAFKEGASLKYTHQDHLTGTSVVTDSSGTIVNTIKYKAYGEARGAPPDSPAQKFTGQRFDTTVGLYYYNARYYDAGLGRFISADTIVPGFSDPHNLNRYTYVLNNPTRYTDPTGHWGQPFLPGNPPPKPPPPPWWENLDGGSGHGDRIGGATFGFLWSVGNLNRIPYPGGPLESIYQPTLKDLMRAAQTRLKEVAPDIALRLPDYMSLNVNLAPRLPKIGTLVGWSGQAAMDRYGNVYLTPYGGTLGRAPNQVSVSLTFGWLWQRETPTEEEMKGFLTRHAINVGGTIPSSPLPLGINGVFVPGSGWAVEIGVMTPQQGGSYHYTPPEWSFRLPGW